MDDRLIQPIFEQFNIQTSIQPGGPDENRADMQSTHQSSADGIEMHFKMLLSHYQKLTEKKGEDPTFSEFQYQIRSVKTIYNHTATVKLGNLRLKDTDFSYQRLLAAFNENDSWRKIHLPPHELKTYEKILQIAAEMRFKGEKKFDAKEIVKLILRSVIIPKIGQRQPLDVEQKKTIQCFQYRNLITNRRALIEYDNILKEEIKGQDEGTNMEISDIKKTLIKLLDSYQNPWYSAYSRTFKSNNIKDHYQQKISECDNYLSVIKF